MKSLSVVLISGLLSGGVVGLSPASGSDGHLQVRNTPNSLGDLVTDDEAVLNLEALLKAEGNQSVQIEFRESTLTASYEADDDEEKRSGGQAQGGDENRPAEKPKSQVNGKIVIIDANGNRKEYQFNGDQARVLQFMQNPAVADGNRPDNGDEDGEKKPSDPLQSETEERYVLGVQCEEASELLRAHLKLGSNGLVILEVREETPAAEAGLKEGDIIVSLNERDLQNLPQLVEAVSESDGAAVKLSLLRAGDRQDISVTPRKMQVPMMVVPAGMEAEEIDNLLGKGVPNLGVRRIHAGVLLDGHVPGEQKDVRELVEQLRQMAEDSEAPSNAESRITITAPGTGEVLELKSPSETENAVRQLQKQVRELQEQLSELQKKVQPTESETTTESASDAKTP